MNVTFYTFSKRINSTAQPSAGASYDVALKSPSSVIRPLIELIWTGAGDPTAFNYAYIPQYRRFYWIAEWTYTERRWAAQMSVDVLASYKSYIGGAEKYILRSASAYDPEVLDRFYPPTAEESYLLASETSGWTATFLGGCYVLNASGYNNPAAVNSDLGVTLYQQTAAQAKETIYQAFNTLNSLAGSRTQVTDVQSAIEKLGELTIRAGANLSQFINGYMWFPALFEPAGTPQPVQLGLISAGEGVPIRYGSLAVNKYIPLPEDLTGFDKWKIVSPYAFYLLEFLPFGTIPLDPVAVVSYGGVFVNVTVDAFTGIGTLRVLAGSGSGGPLLAVRTAQVGIPVQYGAGRLELGRAAADVINGVTQSIAGAASGDVITAGAGIMSAAQALIPDAATGGHTGNIGAISDIIRLWVRRLEPVGEDPTEYGKPLCAVRRIDTLSGYILARDGDIAAPATPGELQQISDFLTGGFFYD